MDHLKTIFEKLLLLLLGLGALLAEVAGTILVLIVIGVILLVISFFSDNLDYAMVVIGAAFLIIGAVTLRSYLRKQSRVNDEPTDENDGSFEDNFRENPLANHTFAAFEKLTPGEVKLFFNISYASADDNVLKYAFKEAILTPDSFDYKDILRNNIDAIEESYINNTKFSILNSYEGILGPKSSLWRSMLWYRPELLNHYAAVCRYLDREPIPELIEDFQSLLSRRSKEQKLIEEKEQAAQALKTRKLKFLQEQLDLGEQRGLSREEISQFLVENFLREFGSSLSDARRIRGKWLVKIEGKIYSLRAETD